MASTSSAAQIAEHRPLYTLPARALRKARYMVVDLWRKYVRNRHHVYSCIAPIANVDLPAGLVIERIDSFEMAGPWISEIRARRTEKHLELMRRELAAHGVMWMALMDGKLAGFLWSRKGRHVPKWFVPLGDDDLQFFAAVTFDEFRGRGIAPAMMRYIMQQEMNGRGAAYVDCAQWNAPAARFFEKAGFSRMGTMKRYSH
ncbi:MAG TPA: GNAT family N-acetyltransferase [Tepidisphaeraceae bacterium]|nr:GNAT family N-acetyltransferase [Tepidisphaeraceae bacterium]